MEKRDGRSHFEDQGVDGRIILKCIFEKREGVHGFDSSGSGYGQVDGLCECNN
jgi:hypothetical protein